MCVCVCVFVFFWGGGGGRSAPLMVEYLIVRSEDLCPLNSSKCTKKHVTVTCSATGRGKGSTSKVTTFPLKSVVFVSLLFFH